MSTPPLDRYAGHFERLAALAPAEREAALTALSLDAAERALLERLGQRREEIEARMRELEMRERLLDTAEKKLDSRVGDLKELETKAGGPAGKTSAEEAKAIRNLVIMYEAMKPKDAARVFDLARQDVAGFDAWARRIAAMFPQGDPVLADVVEGLFIIAVADGDLHEAEIIFIDEVARIFGLPAAQVAAIRARHDRRQGCPSCEVLGVTPDTPLPEARRRWRELVRESHPDRALARGLPPEAIRLAEARTRALNEAWETFRNMHPKRCAGPSLST